MTDSLALKATLNFGARLMGAVFGLLLVVLFARYSKVDTFAAYTLVTALSAICVQLMQLGLPTALTKNVSISAASNKKSEVYRHLTLVFCVFLATGALFCLTAILDNFFETQLMPLQGTTPVIFVGFCVMRVVQNIAVEFSRSVGNYHAYNITHILPQVVSVTVCIMLVNLDAQFTVEKMLVCHIAGSATVVFVVGCVAAGYLSGVEANFRIDIPAITSLVKLALMLTGAAIATTSMKEFSILWVSQYSTPEEIASYGVAIKLLLIFSLGFKAVSSIVTPQIAAALANSDMRSLRFVVLEAVKISAIYYAAGLAFFTFFGSFLILRLFGLDYFEAHKLLLVLAGVSAVTIVTGPLGMVLNMGGHHSRYAFYCLIAAMFSGLLTITVAPYLGVYCAVLAIFGFEILLGVMSARKVYNEYGSFK